MPLTTGGAINDEDPVSDRHRQPVGCPWSSRSDVAGISGRMPWNTHPIRSRSRKRPTDTARAGSVLGLESGDGSECPRPAQPVLGLGERVQDADRRKPLLQELLEAVRAVGCGLGAKAADHRPAAHNLDVRVVRECAIDLASPPWQAWPSARRRTQRGRPKRRPARHRRRRPGDTPPTTQADRGNRHSRPSRAGRGHPTSAR